MDRFGGKVALVTGGASGIGAAVVARLAAEGARVVLVDANGDGAAEVAERVGGDVYPVEADVSIERDVERSMRAAVERYGRVDLYHLNAGIAGAPVPLPEATVDDFDRVMAVNVRGIFLGLREAFRQFEAQDSAGAIVTSASICSFGGGADIVAYHTSKHAILGLMRCAAVYGGPDRDPGECDRAGDRPDEPARPAGRHDRGLFGHQRTREARAVATCRARRTRSPRSSRSS